MKLKKLTNNSWAAQLSGGVYVLFSYGTPVAAYIEGLGYLRTEKVHSRTTSRHINDWLGKNSPTYRPQVFFDRLASEIDRQEILADEGITKPPDPQPADPEQFFTLSTKPKRLIDLE